MKLWAWQLAGAGLCLGLWLPPAGAQYSRSVEELVSRPGTRGPSEYLGGRHGPFDTQPLAMTRRDVALLGQQQRFPFRGRERLSQYSRMLTPGQLGLLDSPLGGGRSRGGGFRGDEASLISGLSYTMNLELPVPGVGPGQLPALNAHLYTPGPTPTRFQQIFRLAPSPAKPEQAVAGTIAERLEARTGERVLRAQQDGMELFKQATVEVRDPRSGRHANCQDCDDKLARAVQQLRLVRDLDTKASVPLLLMAHACLEQERSTQAIDYLLQAFARDPDLLTREAEEPFDRYFGDAQGAGARSAYLATQMRRYRRFSAVTPGSATAKALEAYCAWRLGELAQARDVVDEVEKLAQTDRGRSEELLTFSAAVRAALPSAQ